MKTLIKTIRFIMLCTLVIDLASTQPVNAQELNDERVPSAQSLDSACGDAVPALNSSRGDAVPELDSACGDAATALSSTRGAAPHAPSTLPGLAGARWTAAFSDPYFMGTSMTSTPVISGDTVYVVNRDTLYALSTKTGKTQYELTLPLRMNSVCDPILVDDRLYIPLSGGSLVCVDIQQRAILWTSEEITAAPGISYQTLGRLYYHNGYLYAGVWAMAGRGSSEDVNSTGVFFCVRAKDGSTVWQYQDTSHPAGYYWNQAVSCHDRLYFMSEDGALISHGLTDTKVYETRSLTDEGQVRCGLIASEDGRYLYTVAKNGTLIRITLAADGTIGIVDTICLIANPKEGKWIGSTSTPALWKNRLYVGCSYDGYGVLCVIDTDTFRPIYAAKGPKNGEVKSRPLLIPDPDKPDTVYIYVTANEKNGALYVLTDTTDTKEGTLTTLFTPYSAKQYCLANAVSGEDNTVYYSNDSGTLFAIADTYVSADEPKEVQKKKKKEIDALNKGLHAYLLKLLLP